MIALLGDATRASASRPTSSRSSSRRSSRPTAAPAASTAAPAWAWRSAAKSPACWAARFGWPARPDVGSTFTLYLPQTFVAAEGRRGARRCRGARSRRARDDRATAVDAARRSPTPMRSLAAIECGDDRDAIQPRRSRAADRRQRPGLRRTSRWKRPARSGFKGLVTPSGAAALALARDFQPHAILLDISLPDIDGWRVLRAAEARSRRAAHSGLRRLDGRPARSTGLKLGARGVLPKPIQTADVLEEFLDGVREFVDRDAAARRRRRVRRRASRASLASCSAARTSRSSPVETGAAAIEALRDEPADCVVLTPEPADMSAGRRWPSSCSRRPTRECCRCCLYVDAETPAGARAAAWRTWRRSSTCGSSTRPQRLVDQAALAAVPAARRSCPSEPAAMIHEQSMRPVDPAPARRC